MSAVQLRSQDVIARTSARLEQAAAGVSGQLAAAALLALLAPVLAAVWVAGRGAGVGLVRRRRLGLHGAEFDELGLEAAAPGTVPLAAFGARRWPALANVARGEMALVGPRARSTGELERSEPRHADVLDVKPGLVCSWWVQRRRGIDYGSELDSDLAYVREHGTRGDLGLMVRALAALVMGASAPATAAQSRVLGVWTDSLSMDEAVERIAGLAESGHASQVAFVNADCLNIACSNHDYRACLARARLVLPDGVGVALASRIAGHPLRQNVNGTDLFPRLCARLAARGRRMFLLGAKPGTALKVQHHVETTYPGLSVVGARDGYFDATEERAVIEQVREARADVLLVALGAPRQDLWIRDHLKQLGVSVAIGVGGLFDFYSFAVPRAPMWVRELGMEWAFRLVTEPRRLWKRYLVGNAVFLTRVALELTRLVDYAGDGAAAPDGEAPVWS